MLPGAKAVWFWRCAFNSSIDVLFKLHCVVKLEVCGFTPLMVAVTFHVPIIESSFWASVGSRKDSVARPFVVVVFVMVMLIGLADGPVTLNETSTLGCEALL